MQHGEVEFERQTEKGVGAHAGPLPLSAVTALKSFSSHSTMVPTEDISSFTAFTSSAVTYGSSSQGRVTADSLTPSLAAGLPSGKVMRNAVA